MALDDIFQIGETVICSITVKDEKGKLQDAQNSMNIVIDQISPIIRNVVTSVGMEDGGTGLYYYDCQTSAFSQGIYTITYTATDSIRITIQMDNFQLE